MILESVIELMGEVKGLYIAAVTLSIVYYVFLTLAQWRLFAKAGEKSWKSLIPFYSIFVSHHIIGMGHFWFILDIVLWVFEVFTEIFKILPLWLEDGLVSAAVIMTLVSEIIHIVKLCRCYKKGKLFGVGFFLIPPLFSMILAYGKSDYNPPKAHKAKHKAADKE